MKRAVPEKKKSIVDGFVKIIKEYPIVGIVDVENMPTKQLQKMRAQLTGVVLIKMTKKRLMRIMFEKAKESRKGIEELSTHLRGMPALIFTKNNPFALAKMLDENKSSAPAKPGQKATKDIVVPAGPTPFSPGPVIGELGALRIKTGIEDGKVAIKEPVVVVKEGEEIKPNVASILSRLGIEPMEIGLNLVALYENGLVFTSDVLKIDVGEYINNVARAASESFSLALSIGYATADTISLLIQKAHSDAKALALSESIVADEVVIELLARAESEMQALGSGIDLPAKEESKAEPKKEQKTEPEAEKEAVPEGESKAEPKADAKEESKEEPKSEPEAEKKAEPVPEKGHDDE